MNFKTTYVLFGTLVVIFAVFAVVLLYDTGGKDTSAYVLQPFHVDKDKLKEEDIDRVEIQRNDPKQPTIVLERDSAKQWKISAPVQGRASNAAVENLVRQLADAARTKADKAPSLEAWGLQPPHAVITLSKGTEQTVTLNVGREGGVGDAAVIYVQDPTRAKDPMAVKKQSLAAVLNELPDYRDTVLLAATADDIQGIKIATGNKAVELEKKDGRWRYTNPADYGYAELAGTIAPSDSTRPPNSMNLLLANLTNLRLEKPAADIVADNVSDADLAKYNLDDKSEILQVQVKLNGKDKPAVLLIGVGKKVDDKYYYAKLADERTVVRVKATDADALRNLLNDPGALRSRTLVAAEQPIDAVDVQNSLGTVRLRRQEGSMPTEPDFTPGRRPPLTPDSWRLWRDDNTSLPVEPNVMAAPDSLLNLVKQKDLIVSFIDVKGNLAELEKANDLTKPAAVVSLWVGDDGIVKEAPKDEKKDKGDIKDKDEKKDEKKDDKPAAPPKLKSAEPTFRLSFGKQVNEGGRDLVVVKRETKTKVGDKTSYEVTLAKVPVLVFDKARKGPLSYIDKQLPPYTTGPSAAEGVTKVVFQRPGAVWEMTRANDKDPWKIVKPEAFTNRMADPAKIDQLLDRVNHMTAQELIAQDPTKADLDKLYGLENPPTKVEITVTKDGKTTTHTVRFGKEGPKDGPTETVYGQTSWNDKLVFTMPKFLVEGLPAEYQDTTVAKFDAANVKTLKLTGWQNVAGFPVTLDLERKEGGAWTVKAPPNFTLDTAKVKLLLDALSNLKAEKFVAKLPKPDADLDVAKGALKIEITFEKDDKPLEIVVGKLDGEVYLATSNRVQGEVFTVKKAVFEGPKTKPAYFSP
jgi:hypothetical protein